jgi:5-formyltetrahydrofolate cyclo-ligase
LPLSDISTKRNQLRQLIRQRRQGLSPALQQQAAVDLVRQFASHPQLARLQHIALYLSNDGELDTAPLIKALWQQGKSVYLPILHPHKPGFLVFQHYSTDTPMTENKFGIAEPVLDATQLKALPEIQMIGLPLVAFDSKGNRMGMGGGFYDRTLANAIFCQPAPLLVGLAHQCQQVELVPVEPWDIPLQMVITPEQVVFPKPS